MHWLALLFALVRFIPLAAGLVVPGTVLLKFLRVPWSIAGSFAGSGVFLYLVTLGCAALGVTISPASLLAAVAIFSGTGLIVARRTNPQPEADAAGSWAFLSTQGRALPLYALFWLVVGYRLVTDPLSGPDVSFRWSHLAEEMLRTGSLDFYPPRGAEDFVHYFWPESIPPGVASLYAWAYSCGGNNAAVWTIPVVILQLLSLHDLVWKLAASAGGIRAGRFAVLLAAACPLLTWSFLIGQETGMMAVGVAGLVWALGRMKTTRHAGWAALAAVFGVVAASTREYGVAYVLAGVAGAALLRPGWRAWIVLAAIALPLAAWWPVRSWILTGNPFYSLDLAGLVPVNATFVAWNDAFRAAQGSLFSDSGNWLSLGRYLLLWAFPGLAGVAALVVLLLRRVPGAWLTGGFATLAVALWAKSVGYTAGGLFYSLRTTTPALALLCAAAGTARAAFRLPPKAARIATIAVVAVFLESLPKTLVLPDNPYRAPIAEWPKAAKNISGSFRPEPQLAAKIYRLPGPRRLVSDGFDLPKMGQAVRFEIVPLWSPDAAWLFEAAKDPALAAVHWRASEIRFLVLSRAGPMSGWVQAHAPFDTPAYKIVPIDQTVSYVIYEVIGAKSAQP